MEDNTHNNDNDQHIIEITNDDNDSSLGSSSDDDRSYSSPRSFLSSEEETSDESASSSTSCCVSLWNSMELIVTLVQILAALGVLTMAKDEHPQTLLLAWLVCYTCGCFIKILLVIPRFFRKFNQVEEHSSTRMDMVIEMLKMVIECFFVVWIILGIVWICYSHSSPSDSPKLYRLCVVFIAFSCIKYACGVLLCAAQGLRGGSFVSRLSRDDCCCICLGKYGDTKRQIRELKCLHVFHLQCIDKWVRIKPTCPLCQSLVRG